MNKVDLQTINPLSVFCTKIWYLQSHCNLLLHILKLLLKLLESFFFLLMLKKIRIKCILMSKAFCHCLYQYFPILLSIECVLSMFILGVISNINCLLSSFSWCYCSLQIIVNIIIYKLAHVFVYLNSFPNLEMVDILHFTWNISWYIF